MSNPSGYRRTHTILSPQLSVTSGAPQRLSSSDLWVSSALIIAKYDNAGSIFLGTDSDTALNTNGYGIYLPKKASFEIAFEHHRTIAGFTNLKDFWFDGTSTGDKLIVIYVT